MSRSIPEGPSWLYPTRAVDRSLRARAARAAAWRYDWLRRRVPPLLRVIREVHAASGRGLFVAGADVLEAWLRSGVTPKRFAQQGIWAVAPERRAEFVTAAEMDPFFAATIDSDDRVLMRDKAAFADHASRAGVACLETLAVVNRCERPLTGVRVSIDEPAQLVRALKDLAASADVFLKPAVGKQGHGVYRVSRSGSAVDAEGRDISLDLLTERVFEYRHPAGALGYLVQAALESHPDLVELTGVEALATLRVVTAVCDGAPRSVWAFLKIPAAGRLTNNFSGGVTGTLVSPLDVGGGRLGKLAGILRPTSRLTIERTDTHPATGRKVAGAELPAWREALSLAARGAALHPRTPTLGWDLSRGPQGWRVLEVNTSWGPEGAQAALGRGLRPELARMFPERFG